jgi:hypothetical protein
MFPILPIPPLPEERPELCKNGNIILLSTSQENLSTKNIKSQFGVKKGKSGFKVYQTRCGSTDVSLS